MVDLFLFFLYTTSAIVKLEIQKTNRKKSLLKQSNGMERGSYLGAVVKPPEKGQGSSVTRPDHHGEISFFPLDGHNRSREIHTLHRTWGNTHTFVQEKAPTCTNSSTITDHRQWTFKFPGVRWSLDCVKVAQAWNFIQHRLLLLWGRTGDV